jgi:acetolactate synthase I/II/III large subunit
LANASMRGADALVETLVRGGARTVFTLSGNHIMSVFDAALDRPELALVHVRQEAAAVHAAEALARLTGEVGVALVTGGEGHANAVGAFCTALASETPVVLLSGHAPLEELGLGAFQEMRQADYAAPIAKASWTARSAAALPAELARAFRVAWSGRPGPVHLSLPTDLLEARLDGAAVAWPGPAGGVPGGADAARRGQRRAGAACGRRGPAAPCDSAAVALHHAWAQADARAGGRARRAGDRDGESARGW